MIKLKGTPQEFDDLWNKEINPAFDEIRETIEILDLQEKTINKIEEILEKDINILYKILDDKFDNNWKYFSRSVGESNDETN